MQRKIKIGARIISEYSPIFIIAEAGVNHNGKLELAKKLVDSAKKAKADAIKFQTFRAKDVATEKAPLAEYQRDKEKKKTQREMLEKLELKEKEFIELKKYCDRENIIFLSTPHSEDAIDFLESLVPAYKVGSGDLTNFPFLEKIAEKRKPILLATGMSTLDEVKEALRVVYKNGNKRVILLHCTTQYPCPLEEVNLRAMTTMMRELDCLVGYSDHTLGLTVPIMAASLGAVVIEKHLTLDKSLPGPDHKTSLEPEEFEDMVRKIRDVEIILGKKEKKPTKSEKEIMKLVRKSLIAAEDIKKGMKITRDMIKIKRPGIGIKPRFLKNIIGKITKRDIQKDNILKMSDLK